MRTYLYREQILDEVVALINAHGDLPHDFGFDDIEVNYPRDPKKEWAVMLFGINRRRRWKRH